MRTTIELNPALMTQVMKIGSFKTKKRTIEALLKDYIHKHKMQKLAEMNGSIPNLKIDIDSLRDRK